jgi:hypothetical protein
MFVQLFDWYSDGLIAAIAEMRAVIHDQLLIGLGRRRCVNGGP